MRQPSIVRSLLYSGDLVAVDLGTFSVKVLSLKAGERSLSVLASASREVWRELSAAGTDAEKGEVYTRAVHELTAGGAFRPRSASISLPGSSVILRFATLPAGCPLPPDGSLPAEARALVPFDAADAVVSAQPLDGARGGATAASELLLTVSRRKAVQDGVDAVRRAGLRPAVVVNDALALANAYQFFEGPRSEETVVLAGVGASTTSIVVMEGGVLKAARAVNIAGGTFTRAVKREFGVGFEEAERLKIAHGLSSPADAKPGEADAAARVARALAPAAKDLAAEIQRTIDAFLERSPGDYPPIRRLLLAGGSAELPGLAARLSADAGLSVAAFRPIVGVRGKDGGPGVAALAPDLAGPCGLALSNALQRRAPRERVNLAPRQARRSALIRDVSPGFWRRAAAPALALLLLDAYAVRALRTAGDGDAAAERGLAEAARRDAELRRRFMKPKAPPPARRAADPFSFLARLAISGVFGDGRGSMAMLDGEGGPFTARGGKLYDANEEEVRGVRAELRADSLALTAGGRLYSIELPK